MSESELAASLLTNRQLEGIIADGCLTFFFACTLGHKGFIKLLLVEILHVGKELNVVVSRVIVALGKHFDQARVVICRVV